MSFPHIYINVRNENGDTPLNIVITNNNLYVATALLRRPDLNVDPDLYVRNPIYSAANFGNAACLKILLESKKFEVEFNNIYYSPLFASTPNNCIECVGILLQYVADAQPEETRKRLQQILDNDLESVSASINANDFDINQDFRSGWRVLHIAIYLRNIQLLSLLLSHPQIDVNMEDGHHATPLSLACIAELADVVKLLLKHQHIQPN